MPHRAAGAPPREHRSGDEVREIEIASLGDLIERVTPPQPDPVTGRHRDFGVYRGAFNAASPLLTSLDRLGGVSPPHTKADLEEHILRNYVRYSRPHFARESVNDWEQLVSAQHHGVPTRLLDWTYSPLVAAFFATRHLRDAQHTRAVWRLDWRAVHEAFHFPSLALLLSDLDSLVGRDGHYTPWRLFSRPRDERAFACLLEPPSLDQRIVAQAAAFTISTDKWSSFDDFLRHHGLAHALTKFVIPPQHVARLRDQLDLVGVDERRLFPDLDGVAAAIRRYYA